MAGYSDTSTAFSIVTVILIVFSSALTVLVTAEHSDGNTDRDNSSDSSGQHTDITRKYGFAWPKVAAPSPQYDFSNFNDNIELVECTTNENCTVALPGVEEAMLLYDSQIPSPPYCITSNTTKTGHCTCGEGRCVSYSREYVTGDPFYYCGPCGHVGSKCNNSCIHKLAECRGGYCECIDDGTFYDMSYCYFPYYGMETLIDVIIGTTGILLCSVALAYGYHKLRNRRARRGSIYSERGRGSARREAPSNDTPPSYDDLMEKLPSYQDALNMSASGGSEGGVNNPAFEGEEQAKEEAATEPNTTSPDSSTLSISKTQDHTDSLTASNTGDSKDKEAPCKVESNSNATTAATGEKQDMATQPIEFVIHNAMQIQNTTNTTTL